jgi:hypothetical protein
VVTIPVSGVHSLNPLVGAANEVLEALNASTAGNLAQRRRRIKLHIGLRRCGTRFANDFVMIRVFSVYFRRRLYCSWQFVASPVAAGSTRGLMRRRSETL